MRTSVSDPLQIADVAVGAGTIGITLCPGKHGSSAFGEAWRRDLATDLDAIDLWGATAVVCLIEEHEFGALGVEALPASVTARGWRWLHLPIRDVDVPDGRFDAAWPTAAAELLERLGRGERVLVHCRGGLGRSGTIAACLLRELGADAASAIARVRLARAGAIETSAQERWVHTYRPLTAQRHPARTERRHAAASVGDARRDRAIGALVGLAVGDALGTTLEFAARDTLPPVTDLVGGGPFRLQPGQWTDDTSMALCLAESLLAQGALDQRDVADRFVRWWRDGENSATGRCFDIGGTTRAALARFELDGDPEAGSTDPQSAGNGSIMRLAPVAIAYRAQAARAVAEARRQGRVTHAAPEAVAACALLAEILVDAIATGDRAHVLRGRAIEATPALRAVAAGGWAAKPRSAIASSGYVVHTLEAALWSVGETDGFREAVVLAANLGDDADTVAAVTGQIAGALYGVSAIPSEWRARLAWGGRIERLAGDLYGLGERLGEAAPTVPAHPAGRERSTNRAQ